MTSVSRWLNLHFQVVGAIKSLVVLFPALLDAFAIGPIKLVPRGTMVDLEKVKCSIKTQNVENFLSRPNIEHEFNSFA